MAQLATSVAWFRRRQCCHWAIASVIAGERGFDEPGAIGCLSCGGLRTRPLWSRSSPLPICRCETCDIAFLADPQPEAVHEKYLSDYDLDGHFSAAEARKRVLYDRRVARIGSPSASEPGRICDVGCGNGAFLAVAQEAGWEPHGIEMNPPAAARCRDRGFFVEEGRLEDVSDLLTGTFDVVTAWDVIEHTPDPTRFLQNVASLLSPAGKLYVSTMNRRSLVAKAFRGRWSMVVEDHFTYWTQRSLEIALLRAGLLPTEVFSVGLGRDFIGVADRVMGSSRVPGTAEARNAVTWDAAPAVSRAEVAVNKVLQPLDLGVSLEISARSSAAI